MTTEQETLTLSNGQVLTAEDLNGNNIVIGQYSTRLDLLCDGRNIDDIACSHINRLGGVKDFDTGPLCDPWLEVNKQDTKIMVAKCIAARQLNVAATRVDELNNEQQGYMDDGRGSAFFYVLYNMRTRRVIYGHSNTAKGEHILGMKINLLSEASEEDSEGYTDIIIDHVGESMTAMNWAK